jgi:hypothetical protein
MYAPHEGYTLRVPKLQHYYGLNHLHYLTNSTYRRAHLYDSERFRNQWAVTLGDLRRELGFKRVARTAAFAVRVFSLTLIFTVSYSIAVSKLRRAFLSDPRTRI